MSVELDHCVVEDATAVVRNPYHGVAVQPVERVALCAAQLLIHEFEFSTEEVSDPERFLIQQNGDVFYDPKSGLCIV
jgi:hypothetical protein